MQWRVRHVSHMNEPCHTCKWIMSRIRMSHATNLSESCLTLRVSWLTWAMCGTWLIGYSCHAVLYVLRECHAGTCGTRPTLTHMGHMWDITYGPYVGHYSFGTWLLQYSCHTCSVCIKGTWLSRVWNMPHFVRDMTHMGRVWDMTPSVFVSRLHCVF